MAEPPSIADLRSNFSVAAKTFLLTLNRGVVDGGVPTAKDLVSCSHAVLGEVRSIVIALKASNTDVDAIRAVHDAAAEHGQIVKTVVTSGEDIAAAVPNLKASLLQLVSAVNGATLAGSNKTGSSDEAANGAPARQPQVLSRSQGTSEAGDADGDTTGMERSDGTLAMPMGSVGHRRSPSADARIVSHTSNATRPASARTAPLVTGGDPGGNTFVARQVRSHTMVGSPRNSLDGSSPIPGGAGANGANGARAGLRRGETLGVAAMASSVDGSGEAANDKRGSVLNPLDQEFQDLLNKARVLVTYLTNVRRETMTDVEFDSTVVARLTEAVVAQVPRIIRVIKTDATMEITDALRDRCEQLINESIVMVTVLRQRKAGAADGDDDDGRPDLQALKNAIQVLLLSAKTLRDEATPFFEVTRRMERSHTIMLGSPRQSYASNGGGDSPRLGRSAHSFRDNAAMAASAARAIPPSSQGGDAELTDDELDDSTSGSPPMRRGGGGGDWRRSSVIQIDQVPAITQIRNQHLRVALEGTPGDRMSGVSVATMDTLDESEFDLDATAGPSALSEDMAAGRRAEFAASAAEAAVAPLKSGFLQKQGGSIKTWKRRWCVLTKHSLSYYRTENVLEHPLNVISLAGYDARYALKSEVKRPFTFKLENRENDAVAIPAVMFGWLTKRGGRISTWKDRFCILTRDELSYYKTTNLNEPPQGTLSLRDYDVYLAAASETKRTLEKESKHPHSFKLVNRKGDDLRIYYFSAADADTVAAWVAAITARETASLSSRLVQVDDQIVNELTGEVVASVDLSKKGKKGKSKKIQIRGDVKGTGGLRTYFFNAESQEVCDEWIVAIRNRNASEQRNLTERDGIVYTDDGEIHSGDLLALIDRLWRGDADADAATTSTAANTPGVGGSSDLDSFVDTIVMTFRHFLETPEFFEIIVSRFRSSRRSAERMRAVSILCAWAELFWFVDFCGQPLLADFVAFVDDVKADAEEHLFVKQITRFNYYINNHSAPGRGADGGAGGGAGGGSSASPRPDSMVAIHVSEIYFLSLDAEDVAKQMTLSDCALMRAIKPSEFVVQLWEDTDSDPRMAALTTNLNAFIERFNRTSYWVETVICLSREVTIRAKVIKRMIKIAKYLLDYNNFNGLMAVILGLNAAPVSRLKLTWEEVASKHMATMADLEQVMNPSRNYREYRERQRSCPLPYVPFFGLYIKDMVFQNDGNPKTLDSGYLNVEKLSTLTAMVRSFESMQASVYDFDTDPNIASYLDSVVVLEGEELFKHSLKIEPRRRR